MKKDEHVRKCYWCGIETKNELLCDKCEKPEDRDEKKGSSTLIIYTTV